MIFSSMKRYHQCCGGIPSRTVNDDLYREEISSVLWGIPSRTRNDVLYRAVIAIEVHEKLTSSQISTFVYDASYPRFVTIDALPSH